MAVDATTWPQCHAGRLPGINLAALAAIVVTWYAASGVDTVKPQLAWLNLALVGLVVAGVGNGLWVLRARRALMAARGAALAQLGLIVAQKTPAPVIHGAGRLGSGTGTLYHRLDCPLVQGKELWVGTRAEHEQGGRRPCEACEP